MGKWINGWKETKPGHCRAVSTQLMEGVAQAINQPFGERGKTWTGLSKGSLVTHSLVHGMYTMTSDLRPGKWLCVFSAFPENSASRNFFSAILRRLVTLIVH